MNRNRKKAVFLGILLSLSCIGLPAQTDTLTLTLEQAIEIALSESPTIKIAEKEIQKKKYAKDEVITTLMPQIAASGSYQYTLLKQKMYFDIPGMSGGDPIEMGRSNAANFGISLQLPIVAPSLWLNTQMSATDISLALEKARSSRLQMIEQVKSAYYAILLGKNSLEVLLQSYNNSLISSEKTTQKYKQGVVSEYDALRMEVTALNQRPNILAADQSLRMCILQLKVLLGLGMDIEVDVVGSLKGYKESIYASILSVDSTLLFDNTNLKQLDLQSKMLQQQKDIVSMQYLPTLSGSASYSLANQFNTTSQSRFFPTSSIGLSLSIPIFDGLSKHYKTQQINVSMDAIKLQRQSTADQLMLQLQTNVDQMHKSISLIESTGQSVVLAKKGYEIANKRFDIGTATVIELNDAQLALVNAALQHDQAIFDFMKAKAATEMLLGTEKINDN